MVDMAGANWLARHVRDLLAADSGSTVGAA
jgi:hypothetical protein